MNEYINASDQCFKIQSIETLDAVIIHPIQVQHERKDLLQHTLILRYISRKWWKLSLPYWMYLFLYLCFVIMLTTFAIITPRPGPDDRNCKLTNSTIPTNHPIFTKWSSILASR